MIEASDIWIVEDLAYSEMRFLQKPREPLGDVGGHETVLAVDQRLPQSDAREETAHSRPPRPATPKLSPRQGRKHDYQPEQDLPSSMEGRPASENPWVEVVASSPPTGRVRLNPGRETYPAGETAGQSKAIQQLNSSNISRRDLSHSHAGCLAPSSEPLTWSNSVVGSDSEDVLGCKEGARDAKRHTTQNDKAMRDDQTIGQERSCSDSQQPRPAIEAVPPGYCACHCHAAESRLLATLLQGSIPLHNRPSSPMTDMRERSSVGGLTPLYEDVNSVALQQDLHSIQDMQEGTSEVPASADHQIWCPGPAELSPCFQPRVTAERSPPPAHLGVAGPVSGTRGSTEPSELEDKPSSRHSFQSERNPGIFFDTRASTQWYENTGSVERTKEAVHPDSIGEGRSLDHQHWDSVAMTYRHPHQAAYTNPPVSKELAYCEVADGHPSVTIDMARASARTDQPLPDLPWTSQRRTHDGAAKPRMDPSGTNLGIEETMAGFWRPHRLY